MYSLKQAAISAFNNLVQKRSQSYYNNPVQYTLGMWEYKTPITKIRFCVDDFGVKSFSKEDRKHVLHSLKNITPVLPIGRVIFVV